MKKYSKLDEQRSSFELKLQPGSKHGSPEKFLPLAGGRTLAYADAGDPSSSMIVLRLHPFMSVGSITRMSPILLKRGVHYIAPTLPGWGHTSPPPKASSFASCVIADISALLNHLHHDSADLKIYVVGYGNGSIPAMMLYGASFDVFPLGRCITAVLLCQPFSPLVYGQDGRNPSGAAFVPVKASTLAESSLVSCIAMWLVKSFLQYRLRTPRTAECWVRTAFAKMDDVDRAAYARWREEMGVTEGQLEREAAERQVRSVGTSWAGFRAIVGVMREVHAGYYPNTLDDEHTKRPILVASTRGRPMTQYIVENYRNVQAMYLRSPFDVMWKADEIFARLLSMGV
ncbi:hypothetical protein AcV5_007989 [Taiwanofungus camphoratus]|nr:hypothetical protein AcV5_007989 [Antrodia cinnamomea]KAI0930740.1 hypothetical protein AcV7_004843 [Antrodia cinnamomea]KAI0930741.1 hypothetical protein AcV7_004843 [Antrodia cinnamomea]